MLATIKVDGTRYEVPDIELWTGNEWVTLERELGLTPIRLRDALEGASVAAAVGLLWIARHRVNPAVTVAECGELPPTMIEIDYSEADAVPPEQAADAGGQDESGGQASETEDLVASGHPA